MNYLAGFTMNDAFRGKEPRTRKAFIRNTRISVSYDKSACAPRLSSRN